MTTSIGLILEIILKDLDLFLERLFCLDGITLENRILIGFRAISASCRNISHLLMPLINLSKETWCSTMVVLMSLSPSERCLSMYSGLPKERRLCSSVSLNLVPSPWVTRYPGHL